MRGIYRQYYTVIMIVVMFGVTAVLLAPKSEHPPHTRPQKTVEPEHVNTAAPPPDTVGAGHPGDVIIWAATEAWFKGVAEAEWYAGVQQELERQAAAAAAAAAQRRNRTSSSSSPRYATECGNTALPDRIVYRESRGNCDAYNPSGCGGRGCIGYAQIDQGHFQARSPWNPNVPGSCYGLSYNECVEKLWAGGNGSSHWR